MTILWTIGIIGLRINSFDFKPLTEYTKKKRKLKQLLTDVLRMKCSIEVLFWKFCEIFRTISMAGSASKSIFAKISKFAFGVLLENMIFSGFSFCWKVKTAIFQNTYGRIHLSGTAFYIISSLPCALAITQSCMESQEYLSTRNTSGTWGCYKNFKTGFWKISITNTPLRTLS